MKRRYQEISSSIETIVDSRMLVELKGSIEYIHEKTKNILKEKELMTEKTKNQFTSLEKEIADSLEVLRKDIGDDEDAMLF